MKWQVKANVDDNMCDGVRLWQRRVAPVCATWVCHLSVPPVCTSGVCQRRDFFRMVCYLARKTCSPLLMGRLMQFENNLFPGKGGGQENINQQRVWRQGGARTKLQRIYIVYRNNQLYAYELSCLCIKLLQCQALEIIIIKHRNWFTKYSSYDLLMPPDWITCSIMQVCEITYFM